MRTHYNIWGSTLEDTVLALFMYPWVGSQIEMHVEVDGEGAPSYWADLDAFQAKAMTHGHGLPFKTHGGSTRAVHPAS